MVYIEGERAMEVAESEGKGRGEEGGSATYQNKESRDQGHCPKD